MIYKHNFQAVNVNIENNCIYCNKYFEDERFYLKYFSYFTKFSFKENILDNLPWWLSFVYLIQLPSSPVYPFVKNIDKKPSIILEKLNEFLVDPNILIKDIIEKNDANKFNKNIIFIDMQNLNLPLNIKTDYLNFFNSTNTIEKRFVRYVTLYLYVSNFIDLNKKFKLCIECYKYFKLKDSDAEIYPFEYYLHRLVNYLEN